MYCGNWPPGWGVNSLARRKKAPSYPCLMSNLRYLLQLVPEIADEFSGFDKVVFIDAHTGAVGEEIHLEQLSSHFQASPLTHHLTPASCLAIAAALHGDAPEALLVSVRGYQFGFENQLSPQTASLVPLAADAILKWLV